MLHDFITHSVSLNGMKYVFDAERLPSYETSLMNSVHLPYTWPKQA